MHWRKVPSKSDGKGFYAVIALFASVTLTTALLVLLHHV
jgi:hypothetical protein